MKIERHEEMRVSGDVEREIASLLEICFPTDFGGRSFFQNRHHVRLLAREGGKLAGHLAVGFRAVRLGGRLLDVVGFAEVAVHPAFRRRGIGAALVEAGLEEGRAAGAGFALLFGEQPIYAKAGFVTMSNPIVRVAMYGAQTEEIVRERAEHLMVQPLGDEAWDEAAELDLAGFTF